MNRWRLTQAEKRANGCYQLHQMWRHLTLKASIDHYMIMTSMTMLPNVDGKCLVTADLHSILPFKFADKASTGI